MKPKLVLLDRDGVLNRDRPDSVKSPGELVMLEGAAAAVARLNHFGCKVALVSNQSVVGRGIIDADMLALIHNHLADRLAREGARLDAIFVCTDPPGPPSQRRKPAPGMVIEAMRQFGIAAGATAMIGDDLRDLQAAAAAGCARILVRSGKGAATQAAGLPGEVLPVAVYENLAAAVEALLAEAG
ncbi:MAG: HAD-IIIA family hydrolase [Rhodospirillales bacterium]